MQYPYLDKGLDSSTIVLFLATLCDKDFLFDIKYNLHRVIDQKILDIRLTISEKPPGWDAYSKQMKEFNESKDHCKNTNDFNDDDDIEPLPPPRKIFKLMFDSKGNDFYIQIL